MRYNYGMFSLEGCYQLLGGLEKGYCFLNWYVICFFKLVFQCSFFRFLEDVFYVVEVRRMERLVFMEIFCSFVGVFYRRERNCFGVQYVYIRVYIFMYIFQLDELVIQSKKCQRIERCYWSLKKKDRFGEGLWGEFFFKFYKF